MKEAPHHRKADTLHAEYQHALKQRSRLRRAIVLATFFGVTGLVGLISLSVSPQAPPQSPTMEVERALEPSEPSSLPPSEEGALEFPFDTDPDTAVVAREEGWGSR